MAQGQVRAREGGELRDVENVSLPEGSVSRVQARFGGELYEVWPPDDGDGFEVAITDANALDGTEPNFDVQITDSRSVDPE